MMKFDSEANGVRPELNFQNSWYMNMHFFVLAFMFQELKSPIFTNLITV